MVLGSTPGKTRSQPTHFCHAITKQMDAKSRVGQHVVEKWYIGLRVPNVVVDGSYEFTGSCADAGLSGHQWCDVAVLPVADGSRLVVGRKCKQVRGCASTIFHVCSLVTQKSGLKLSIALNIVSSPLSTWSFFARKRTGAFCSGR